MQTKTKRQAMIGIVAGVIMTLAGMVAWKRKTPAGVPDTPAQFSLSDWKQALWGAKESFGKQNLPVLAAGVAYFSTLSFFPMIAAAVAIAAFVITPEQLRALTSNIEAYLPADMASLVTTQLQNSAGHKAGNVIAAVIAIGISLFGASGAISNLITAANVSYDSPESRNFFKLKALSLALTLGAILMGFVIMAMLAVSPGTLAFLGLPSWAVTALLSARWLLLIMLVTLALAIFYRYGPNRSNAKWQWVSWGALIATVIWLIGTVLFFVYVQYFGNFSKSYSLFAGIIVLMTWLNLSAFIVLLGAEVNHRLELQTAGMKVSK